MCYGETVEKDGGEIVMFKGSVVKRGELLKWQKTRLDFQSVDTE